LQTFDAGSYAVYRIKFKPFAGVQKSGGQIVFKSITGKAEVWLDKQLVGHKDDAKTGPLTVTIPPATGERTLSVLVEGAAGKQAGLGGAVHVQALAK
jgi:beta-galactosidase